MKKKTFKQLRNFDIVRMKSSGNNKPLNLLIIKTSYGTNFINLKTLKHKGCVIWSNEEYDFVGRVESLNANTEIKSLKNIKIK